MNSIDLLILTGAPGAGKSSVTKALSNHLQEQDTQHAVIELDDLARVYPLPLQNIMYSNLAAIWPNYVSLGDTKVIIPTYLQIGELDIVKKAAPANRLTVCELSVSEDELTRRISNREKDELRRTRLLNYVGQYTTNRVEDESVQFTLSTTGRSVGEVAIEIIQKLDWSA